VARFSAIINTVGAPFLAFFARSGLNKLLYRNILKRRREEKRAAEESEKKKRPALALPASAVVSPPWNPLVLAPSHLRNPQWEKTALSRPG